MKKILLLIFALIFINLFPGLTKTSFAQSTTTMQDIIESVNSKVSDLEDKQNQEVVNITMDLLVNNGEKNVYRFLDPAFKYDVLVIGDRRISKLKIKVYKQGKRDLEAVDEFSSAKPLLRIEPTEYAQYQFTVSADEFKTGENTGHFALLLYHKNPERDK